MMATWLRKFIAIAMAMATPQVRGGSYSYGRWLYADEGYGYETPSRSYADSYGYGIRFV